MALRSEPTPSLSRSVAACAVARFYRTGSSRFGPPRKRGCTCSGFIQSLRLDQAARSIKRRALMKSGQPLREMARACGFAITRISPMRSANGSVTHPAFMCRATTATRCVTQGTKGRVRPTTHRPLTGLYKPTETLRESLMKTHGRPSRSATDDTRRTVWIPLRQSTHLQ
jgi:hypothetical protein